MADAYPSPAKINLMLRVLGRRDDGYHELQTVYQLLDWGDLVRIERRTDGVIERATDLEGVPADEDLSLRAAHALRDAAHVHSGVTIDIDKRIPMGAGLGGGSSNAATVLVVLNRLWRLNWPVARLAAVGRTLGADVPMFVHGHTAFAGGIGDEVQRLALGHRTYLLLVPDVHVPTAEIFAAESLPRDQPPIVPGRWRRGPLENACESVVRERYPEVDEAFGVLADYGRPRLSGTGSAVFVEMANIGAAQRAAAELDSRYNVRAVRGADRSPLYEVLEG